MSQVNQTKEKDFDIIEPKVSFTDLPEERFNMIVQACRDSYSKLKQYISSIMKSLIIWGNWDQRI